VTVAVIIFGLCMAGLVGWLVRQSLLTPPWLATGPGQELASPEVRARQRMRLMLAVVVAVVTSLFGLFISAYLIRMDVADWRPMPEPGLLWGNTAVLVLCSVALQWGFVAAKRGDLQTLKTMVLAGGVLSVMFISGQYVVWQQLAKQGYYLTSNPANDFFYVLTALHVLHVAGGLVAWLRTASRLFGGGTPEQVRLGVELCATYWHFLLAVWIVLLALLSST
jgi:cytochrome c oxidase subunit III